MRNDDAILMALFCCLGGKTTPPNRLLLACREIIRVLRSMGGSDIILLQVIGGTFLKDLVGNLVFYWVNLAYIDRTKCRLRNPQSAAEATSE